LDGAQLLMSFADKRPWIWQSMSMKLSDWAGANGISYKLVWLWWRKGRLSMPPSRAVPEATLQGGMVRVFAD